MTRREAMAKLNLEKLYQLADKLELSTAAIALWGDEKDIPDYRQFEVNELAAGRVPPRLLRLKQNLAQTNA
ncbi:MULTISPECIES: ribonuclease D [unclassified Acinetobacter]|uniref:ribonuclease D n=1 Tax=unclassified Acinetobacter TaxID=196816 RepID=UPI00124FC2CD|nr:MULTISPECIES: ribonuclease D [unclassified Acinetobacter]